MAFDDIEEMIRKYLSTGVAVVIILVSPTAHTGETTKPSDPNAVVIPEPGSPPTSETSPPSAEPAPDNSGAADTKPETTEPAPTDKPQESGDKPSTDAGGGDAGSGGGEDTGASSDAPAPGTDVSSEASEGGGEASAPDSSTDSSGGDSGGGDSSSGDSSSGDESKAGDSKDESKSDDSKDGSKGEEPKSDSKDDSSGGESASTSSESSSSDPGGSSDSATLDPAGIAPQNPPRANPAPVTPAPANPASDNAGQVPNNPAPASATASASATAGGVTASSSASSGPAANGSAPAAPNPPVAGAPAPAPVTAAERLGWGAPKLQDDFSGGLDRWKVYTGTGHAGKGKRSPSAVTVKDGILTLSGDQTGTTGGLALTPGQKYGRWEARVRTPAADPSYNAVMLLWPDADDFPVGGEIDFMELSDPTRQTAGMFVHHGANNQQVSGQVKIDATQWHTWAVEWTPEAITGYVDGKEWFRNTDTATFPPGPMHLCIQLDWFPNGAGNPKPSTMEVDWVRQYAHDGSGPAKPTDNSATAAAAKPFAESARRMFSLR
jgi:Glycosyl hydrolases family 16